MSTATPQSLCLLLGSERRLAGKLKRQSSALGSIGAALVAEAILYTTAAADHQQSFAGSTAVEAERLAACAALVG
jgi:hypothetical protein